MLQAETPGFWGILRAIKCEYSFTALTKFETNICYLAPTCSACEKYKSAIKGMLILGGSLSLALQQEMDDTLKDLWTLTLLVSLCV